MQRKMQLEREEAEKRRIDMMKKEIQYRENDNLMNVLKTTENKIHQIVDRGQQQLYEKKNSREEVDSLKRTQEYEKRVQERERQYKEYNEHLMQRMSEEKENQRLN